MADCFIGSGLYKINELIAREDFKKVESIVNHNGVISAVLVFDNKACTLNSLGKCEWIEKPILK